MPGVEIKPIRGRNEGENLEKRISARQRAIIACLPRLIWEQNLETNERDLRNVRCRALVLNIRAWGWVDEPSPVGCPWEDDRSWELSPGTGETDQINRTSILGTRGLPASSPTRARDSETQR